MTKAKTPDAGAPKIPASVDNLILLNILRHGFNYSSGVAIADFLNVTEVAVSRARKGTGDVAGLAPAVLELLYPGVLGVALDAQLTEYELRTAHAEMDFARRTKEELPERLSDTLERIKEKADSRLSRLRDRLREARSPMTPPKRQERAIDRAALASLEGQLELYRKNYKLASAAFKQAFSFLGSPNDLGSKVLFVRSMINWYFANHQMKVNVTNSLAQDDFVKLVIYVSFVTGDSRVAVNERHDLAANLLCDAAERLDIKASDLPEHHPVGHEVPLSRIPALETSLNLAKQVENQRREERETRSSAKRDLNGVPFGSLPDDVSLNLSSY
ncbi:hypothetical protein FXB41_21525 [Bradyrhizobium canariense]|uniref:hypothetical protein n=1 Tax=Bradyrhizobium canariense TaxID=255045 RepID=UPI001CA4F03D|nr:hypothetical protein [Bradyrhizobium canariense]MBW5437238.1 hypothetical protein [Bradyrhizobium canariense]